MSPKDESVAIPERVEQEHEHLQRALKNLAESSSSPISGEGFAQWRLELIWQVRDFKNDLLKHFDLEEEGGFMRDVRRMVPNSDPQVTSLLQEHQEMEQSLDRVLRRLKSMPEWDEEGLRQLQQEIADFVAAIREHESTEQHLVQRTYYRDYGGPE